MRVPAFDRHDIFQTIIVLLLTLLAVAALSVMLAYWTWIWLAAPSVSHPGSSVHIDNRMEAAYGLFGITQQAENGGVTAAVAGPVKLLGIIAATNGRQAYALLQLNATDIVVVHEGDNLSPGVRLAEVANNHLILERGTIRESLTWVEKTVVKN